MLKDCFSRRWYSYVDYPEMLKQNKELVAQILCAQGGRRWQKGNLDRVYFPAEALGFNLKAKKYTGELASLQAFALANNSEDREVLQKLPRWAVIELKETKAFVDLEKGDWAVVLEAKIEHYKQPPRFIAGIGGFGDWMCVNGRSVASILWEVLEFRLTETVHEALKKVKPIPTKQYFDEPWHEPRNIFEEALGTREDWEKNRKQRIQERNEKIKEFYR